MTGGDGALGAALVEGEPGIGIADVTADDYAFRVLLTNGKAITFDLRGMFERYDEERAA